MSCGPPHSFPGQEPSRFDLSGDNPCHQLFLQADWLLAVAQGEPTLR
jgi:hypothetical protein